VESWIIMPDMRVVAGRNLDPAQATELAVLVDMEARWENLRKAPPPNPRAGYTLLDLQGRQKAYEAFHAKLVAYNKRFTPAHAPELLLNTTARLGTWCGAMRDLFRQVEQNPRSPYPAHVLEKAFRWANQVGARLQKPCLQPSPAPFTIAGAIHDLEALTAWCVGLTVAPLLGQQLPLHALSPLVGMVRPHPSTDDDGGALLADA